MAVPKKRTSISKRIIRNTFWKKKAYWTALKAFSLAQSLFTGNSKSFVSNKNKYWWEKII
uniref:Large ribosomal subunit protein bL32c n=1 Tax=Mirbelia oxylobioides TaxID=140937 RepID=A0A6H0EF65_9FABA|nr:ribosomal protein L32 [Mirbelia oxylobioides]QIT00424.1 ribosomal protein L32 [Mirbelia oxylobioides]